MTTKLDSLRALGGRVSPFRIRGREGKESQKIPVSGDWRGVEEGFASDSVTYE